VFGGFGVVGLLIGNVTNLTAKPKKHFYRFFWNRLIL